MFLFIGYVFRLLVLVTIVLSIPSIRALTASSPLASPMNKALPAPTLLTPNIPASISNYSLAAENAIPVCKGNLLGFDMNRYSCVQALNTIPVGHLPRTFGDRSDGTFDVQLPRRFSGRECPALS